MSDNINSTENSNNDVSSETGKFKWFKRLGWGAFAFFLIKGLVWLAVFFGASKFLGC